MRTLKNRCCSLYFNIPISDIFTIQLTSVWYLFAIRYWKCVSTFCCFFFFVILLFFSRHILFAYDRCTNSTNTSSTLFFVNIKLYNKCIYYVIIRSHWTANTLLIFNSSVHFINVIKYEKIYCDDTEVVRLSLIRWICIPCSDAKLQNMVEICGHSPIWNMEWSRA